MVWNLRLVAAVGFTVVASCVCPAVLTVYLVSTDAFFTVHNIGSGEEVRVTHDGAWEVDGQLQCSNDSAWSAAGASGNTTMQPCPLVKDLDATLSWLQAMRVLAWVCVPIAVLRFPLVGGMLWMISTRRLGTQWWVWPAVCLCTVGMIANFILCASFIRSVPLTDAQDWVVVPTTPSFLLALLWNEMVLLLLTVGDLLNSKELLSGDSVVLFKLLAFLVATIGSGISSWRPFSFLPDFANVLFLIVGLCKVVGLVAVVFPDILQDSIIRNMPVLLYLPLLEFLVWTIWFSAAATPTPYITFFVDYTDSFLFPMLPMPTLALMTYICIMHIREFTGYGVLLKPEEWTTDKSLQAIDVNVVHQQLLEDEEFTRNMRMTVRWRLAVEEDDPRYARCSTVWDYDDCKTMRLAVRGMCGRLLVALLAGQEGVTLGLLLGFLMQAVWGRLLLRSTTALSRRPPSVLNLDVLSGVSSSRMSNLLHLHTCVPGGIWHLFPDELLHGRQRGSIGSPVRKLCSFYEGHTAGAIAECLMSFGFPVRSSQSWDFSFRQSFCRTLDIVDQVLLAAGINVPYVLPVTVARVALFFTACVAVVTLHAVYNPQTADGMSAWMFVAFLVFASVCLLSVVVPEWLVARLSLSASRNPRVVPEAEEMRYRPTAVTMVEQQDPPSCSEAGQAPPLAVQEDIPTRAAPHNTAGSAGDARIHIKVRQNEPYSVV